MRQAEVFRRRIATLQHHDQRRRQPYFKLCELQVALEYASRNMFRGGRLLHQPAIGKTFPISERFKLISAPSF